ncbi:hemerythrin domain-containing protein [Streptomyces sp. NPDC046215]|uniref:Hemerythrin domain-containing protein n=1 Tax=Streptomyces stramineus TaxID=173861 RepID=A0ABP3KTF7_9ACTN
MARTDIITELETDHRAIEALFQGIHRTPLEDPRRESLLDEVAAELARHYAIERQYLYPALREYLAGGDACADEEAGGQERLTAMLRGLETRTVYEPGFDARVRVLEREVAQHVRHEEHDLFPRLRHTCPHGTLCRLGDEVRQGRGTAEAARDTAEAVRGAVEHPDRL